MRTDGNAGSVRNKESIRVYLHRVIVVETGLLFRETASLVRRRRRTWWLLIAAGAVLSLACIPVDHAVMRWFKEIRTDRLYHVAGNLRRWGSFNDTLVFSFLIMVVGMVLGRRRWRRAALACFLAAALAGLSVNVVRFSAGRPRPKVEEVRDGFYGPTFEYRMQSFPSGHCCASYANATALAVAIPGLALPVFASATAVAWASLYQLSHYPTDVVFGGAWGVVFGLVFGLAARKRDDTD